MTIYRADTAWLPQGWESDVVLEVRDGRLAAVDAEREAGDAERLGRWVLPGVPNLHSHAFQRAMAGLAERQTNPEDSFWTWRETMYVFAGRVGPDELRAIAAQLYVEMLEAGYTQVPMESPMPMRRRCRWR
jgi:formimidoylglutamate deiminase